MIKKKNICVECKLDTKETGLVNNPVHLHCTALLYSNFKHPVGLVTFTHPFLILYTLVRLNVLCSIFIHYIQIYNLTVRFI